MSRRIPTAGLTFRCDELEDPDAGYRGPAYPPVRDRGRFRGVRPQLALQQRHHPPVRDHDGPGLAPGHSRSPSPPPPELERGEELHLPASRGGRRRSRRVGPYPNEPTEPAPIDRICSVGPWP